MSEPSEKQARVVWLDMSCPCGAKFGFEYTTGNAVLKEMVELATAWVVEHRHSELRVGPGEAHRPEPGTVVR